MPTRKLPKSVAGYLNALSTAKLKNDALDPGDRFLTAATQARLDAIYPLLYTAQANSNTALAAQATATSTNDAVKSDARIYISHFYQVFNLGVMRGKYPAGHRAFYHLDVATGKLPALITDADIVLQGERIVTGDAARITAGGSAMANPSVSDVTDKVTAYISSKTGHSTLKDAYDASLEAVQALIPEASAVVKKIWDEVETYYNEETASSKRRNAREWGVYYESDIIHNINVMVTDSVSGDTLAGVTAEIIETGLIRTTIVDGTCTLSTKASESVTLRFSLEDYVTQDSILEFVTGTTDYPVTIALVHV